MINQPTIRLPFLADFWFTTSEIMKADVIAGCVWVSRQLLPNENSPITVEISLNFQILKREL